eukprot:TRINITY_DN32644_c0_g2_i1.p1 TRINITY_DN32644_c0_g2~~TRINITY_DN32644_c0_g2_i1.p1  ORF type:complete len:661 (-),score=141.18 TRINITY_DN32644_c0_g2_i1:36-2018(-)
MRGYEEIQWELRGNLAEVTRRFSEIDVLVASLQAENTVLRARESASPTNDQLAAHKASVPVDIPGQMPAAGEGKAHELRLRISEVNVEKAASVNSAQTSCDDPASISLAASKFGMLKTPLQTSLHESEDLHSVKTCKEMVKAFGFRRKDGFFMLRFVESFGFKAFSMFLIIVNALYLGFAANINVKNSWRRLNNQEQTIVSSWPDIAFVCWFAIEMVVRIVAHQLEFLLGDDKLWNLLDVLLVAEAAIGQIAGSAMGGTLSFLRILRVFRLVRIVRVVRTVPALRRLRTMIFSILNCFVDLLWAFLVILLILFVFGIIFANAVASHFDQVVDLKAVSSTELDNLVSMHTLFGGMYPAMLSLWCAVSGGNDWMMYGDVLSKLEMGEVYLAVFLFYIAFCVVGLFNVVTGVFVDSAVCSRTEDEVVAGYILDLHNTTEEIKKFFQQADANQDDKLNFDEFSLHLQTPHVRAYFAGLDIDPAEALIMFTLLDVDQSKEITVSEFVNGIMKMKGKAKSMDLMCLMYDSARLAARVHNLSIKMDESLKEIRSLSMKDERTEQKMSSTYPPPYPHQQPPRLEFPGSKDQQSPPKAKSQDSKDDKLNIAGRRFIARAVLADGSTRKVMARPASAAASKRSAGDDAMPVRPSTAGPVRPDAEPPALLS